MTKRKQLTINLGDEHEAWLELAKAYGHRPATLAAYGLKATLTEPEIVQHLFKLYAKRTSA